jgi:hypothetical protein
MIRIVRLDNGNEQCRSTTGMQQNLAKLHRAKIDILCCQDIWRSMDDRKDATRILTDSLRMTYSCFAASHHRQKKTGQKSNGVSGLAIFTGSEMWMLNSGSFPVLIEPDGTKRVAQFALVRKNGISILVLNLQICRSRQTQRMQLCALFSHPMLKERYGAVVLCSDQQIVLSVRELKKITDSSNYAPYHSLASPAVSLGEGVLCVLIAREQAVASVTICSAGGGRVTESENPAFRKLQASQSLEFELNRIPQDKENRLYLPLSFRERSPVYQNKRLAITV